MLVNLIMPRITTVTASLILCLSRLFVAVSVVSLSASAATQSRLTAQQIAVGDEIYGDIQSAFRAVKPGGTIRIGPGTYRSGGTLKTSGVLILAHPDSLFDGAVAGGKATFVIQGDNTVIEGMNCRNVAVRDRNGACIRHESRNLVLRNVHFYDSQQGILAGGNSVSILIEDSKFINLGENGRAHGIYVNAGSLIVRRTIVTGSKDQAHGIKHRGPSFLLEDSLVASDQADDSRLIDLPNGGDAVIRNNLLVEGPNSLNWSLLSWGAEGIKYDENRLVIERNTIIGDRPGGAEFIQAGDGISRPVVSRNVVIGNIRYDWPASNYRLQDRREAGLPEGTAVPDWTPPSPTRGPATSRD